jgi:tetratricopeptide (TPR) repeat protein
MSSEFTVNQELEHAFQLLQSGNYEEAVEQFSKAAAITEDSINRAGILLNLASTLTELARFDEAQAQIEEGRTLLLAARRPSPNGSDDLKIKDLEICFELQEAEISRAEGKYDEALSKLNALLSKHDKVLRKSEMRANYELIQSRRALLLGDLDRCNEAIPILEETKTFKEDVVAGLRGEISFYLGSCYSNKAEWSKAETELSRSLHLGLRPDLEFRAHCRLGKAYHKLEDYAQAKLELEKAAETADASYIKEARLWEWLESTCRHLGLTSEAEHYAQRARPS